MVITRALCGLKSSGASWRTTLAATLIDMGFEETKADPNVWRREARKGSGDIYYELLLIYVDDILCISHDPRPILDTIDSFYKIKEGSLEEPSTYLGAQIYKLRMFGVPINGPASIMCDNQGVVKIPDSTLTKHHKAINYHIIHEAVAAGIIKIGKEDTKSNLADLLTKVLSQEQRNQLLSYMTYSSAFDKHNPPARAMAGAKRKRFESQNES